MVSSHVACSKLKMKERNQRRILMPIICTPFSTCWSSMCLDGAHWNGYSYPDGNTGEDCDSSLFIVLRSE